MRYMTRTFARPRRGAHLLLLAALLLYVGSVAVEPLVHAAAPAAAEVLAADAEHDETIPAAEHECSACKLTRVFSSGGSAVEPVPAAVTYVAAPLEADVQVRGPPAFTTAQPRAPPHA
jgi:hypothetical protein